MQKNDNKIKKINDDDDNKSMSKEYQDQNDIISDFFRTFGMRRK
jgi:hypothetical protein